MKRSLSKLKHYWFAVALLFLLFAQLVTSASVKSATFDEPTFASYGYVDLTTMDWRMQVYHPPFVHLLTGLTLWTLPNRPDPRALPAWSNNPGLIETAWEVLDAFDRPIDVLIFPQRVVVMGLTLLLGAVLFRWAKDWHGRAGSVLALFVYTFSPNILAHGRLVTTDLAFTCCFALAVYTFQRLMVQPSIKRMIMAGLTLGLALGSKMSALMLIPLFALFVLLRTCQLGTDRQSSCETIDGWSHRLAYNLGWLVLTGVMAFFVLWALYGFETGSWHTNWPKLPLVSYVKSLLRMGRRSSSGHQAFLMGYRSSGDWAHYFLVALLSKTPLPILMGALWGTAWSLWRRRWWTILVGILTPALFFIAALGFWLNIGYRHILPILPFLAHLLSSGGDVLGVDDGLGTWPPILLPGDVIVQRHRFPVTWTGGVDVWLRSGGYWLDTMEQWSVADVPGTNTLLIQLETD